MSLLPIFIMIAYAALAFIPLLMVFDTDGLIQGDRGER